MKGILAVLGIVALVVLVVNSGVARGFFERCGFSGFGSSGVAVVADPNCDSNTCVDQSGQIDSVQGYPAQYSQYGGISTRLNYEQQYVQAPVPVYNRVWVAPVYQQVVRYGRVQTVMVRQGYWNNAGYAAPRQAHRKHFDFGAIISAFGGR